MRDVAYDRRYVVVMAGGVGSRFWPWSRQDRPKQLLDLSGGTTMLGETVARVGRIAPLDNVIVITGAKLKRGVRSALPDLPAGNVFYEPVGRNTAACVGWAAREVLHRNPEGVMAVLPADHAVSGKSRFEADMRAAYRLADTGALLVTFGLKPNAPSTGYGYIKAGAALTGTRGAKRVVRFYEKPSVNRAKRFIRQGNFFWNSGMFVWRADTILAEIDRHLPRLSKGLAAMDAKRRRGRIAQAVVDRHYPRLQSISIDHGVMEKARHVAVVPASFAWSDIGSWDALADVWPSDPSGNSSRDPVVAIDSSANIVATNGKPVALVGVEGLAVVDSGDALLVCRRDRSQDVRKVVEKLRGRRLSELL